MIRPGKKNEFLYFALRNPKLRVGLTVVGLFLLLALFGPLVARSEPFAYVNPLGAQPPSSEFWFGTTFFGQDVFAQFVLGLRATFIVDELLNMLTNIVLVIPTVAVLLIVAAYLEVRSVATECIFIGLTAWPWAARAIRAQTFSLRTREFVDLARMSGMKPLKIIFAEIAPNMMSYLVMTFILQFGGAILIAATLDFIGLGPTNAISLGLMMQYAVLWGALLLGMWWWFIPPGLGITAIVGALYVMNVGLDEVFNPKLREM
jgi:peptide/nickel transport system permease protein